LYSLDEIVLVKNAIVRTALRQMDFHQTCLLLKTASEPAQDKIMTNLPGRSKSIIEQELSLIEAVDADDVQAATEDFLDEIRDLMEAEEASKSNGE
jgi:flagellar motor switch protein FliG